MKARTDNTGNNVKSETMVAEYKEIRFDIVWQKYMDLNNIELDVNGYSNKKFVAIAKSFISNQRILDDLYSGFTDGSDAFITKVKEGHKGFAFDSAKTEDLEID